ncbi:G-protein coupled receptor 26-like [Ptychodera flava]|uniref:G-protein coupled receptor 26-like n=1 Tax=Ptychodera flava TaxID=63121 RepID=UPI00396A0996
MDVNTQGDVMMVNSTQATIVNGTSAVTSAGFRAFFLLVFIILSLIGNVGLVMTIGTSDRLKQYVMNLFLLNVGCVFVCDSVLNMPLILGSSIAGYWPMGNFMCRYNAFFVQIIDIEVMLGLGLLAMDRLVAAKSPHKYPEQFSRLRTNLLICATWIQATVIAFPLLVNGIDASYFNSRFLCSVANGSTLVYLVFTSVTCFVLPVFFIMVAYIIIIRVGVTEKLRVRALNTHLHYANDLLEQSPLWEEMRSAKFTGILQFLWCILYGPYLLMNAIGQYQNVPIIESSDIGLNLEYSSDMETAFTWMKLAFSCTVPFLTFFMRAEFREDLKFLLTCNRDAATGASPRNNTPVHIIQKKAVIHVESPTPVSEKKHPLKNFGYQVPVLFATANGLRLQIGNNYEENDVVREERDCFNSELYGSKGSSTEYDSTMNSTRTAELGLTGELEETMGHHGYRLQRQSMDDSETERIQTKSVLSKSEINIERKTPTSPRMTKYKTPKF